MNQDETERLTVLRVHRQLPLDLDALASEAAAVGRLREADDAAREQVWSDVTSSSQSGASRVPSDGLYTNYPDVEAAYFDALRRELLRVLGRSG